MSDRKQNSSDDSELDRDLAAASRAYQHVDADLPPPAMDDAIRASARRAVKSQPHVVGKSWISRWSAPLSATALVVLTVSVGFVALDERPDLAPAVVSELAIPRPAEKLAAAAPASAPESSPPAKLNAPQAKILAPTAEKKVLAENRAVAQDQVVQSPKVDQARRRNESVTVAKDLNVPETPARAGIVPVPAFASPPLAVTTPAAAPAPPSPVEAKVFVADPVAGAIARKESVAAAVESTKREMAFEKQASGQIAGVSGTARSDVTSAQKVRAPSQTATSAAAPPALDMRIKAAAPASAAAAAPRLLGDKLAEPANAWMKRILELKQQGKTREVEDELTKFRKRYPDYLLPEELKQQK